ncbi:hypothetical protein M011DRAFT_462561 [Sporormia fimetaria CBS 119925]|uniref:Uncharacterized protein n=1 Tax=Sporormia fimetaria CBS 119925 TaxID=1340428 RepID=A0A6A6UW09_9PLEO|nr:hypothetical protein M011DRAFT_462561 [Sporormia fimetaria CBS 119925]
MLTAAIREAVRTNSQAKLSEFSTFVRSNPALNAIANAQRNLTRAALESRDERSATQFDTKSNPRIKEFLDTVSYDRKYPNLQDPKPSGNPSGTLLFFSFLRQISNSKSPMAPGAVEHS